MTRHILLLPSRSQPLFTTLQVAITVETKLELPTAKENRQCLLTDLSAQLSYDRYVYYTVILDRCSVEGWEWPGTLLVYLFSKL